MSSTTANTCSICQKTYDQAYYGHKGNAIGCNRCLSHLLNLEPTPSSRINLVESSYEDWKSIKDENLKLTMENTKLKQEVKSLRGSVMRAWEDEAAKYIIEGAESQDPSTFKSEVPTFACMVFEFFTEYIVSHDAVKNNEILRSMAEDLENSLYSFYNKSAVELLDEEDKTHDWFVKEEEESDQ